MKNLFVFFSIFYLAIFPTFGQENALYIEVQQAKKSNVYFENAVLEEVRAEATVLENFVNLNEIFFFGNLSLDVKHNKIKAINLIMPLKTKNMVLELIEVPDDFYNYEVMTSDGDIFSASKDIKHYRGIVRDVENSLVAITFYEDEIMGLVSTNEGNFNIIKDRQSGKHIFYNENNLKEKPNPICSTENDPSLSYESEVLSKQRHVGIEKSGVQTRAINKYVRFFVETEYDIYQTRGSVSSVEAFIAGLFNQVAVLYQNEDILTNVSYMYIWTSTDPYTATSTSSLLSQFQSTRTSIIGDLGILLTFRSIGGGIAAGFSGLCNASNGQKLSVAMLYNRYSTVPTYSWSVMVVTHELGHLFGSRHTHACVWNGNNTAIDGCAGYTEPTNPNSGGSGKCSLPSYPSGGGTMMSYCHQQSVGINFNLGFGPQPGNVIRNSVINANCLQNCNLAIINETYNSGIHSIIGCTVEISNTTIEPNTTVRIHGQQSVVLKSGFHAKAGSNVKITAGGELANRSIENSIDYDNEDTISMLKSLELAVETTVIADVDFIVFPNPNDGNFTLQLLDVEDMKPYSVQIFSSTGAQISKIEHCNTNQLKFNHAGLPSGVYYVKLSMGINIVTKKVIIQ